MDVRLNVRVRTFLTFERGPHQLLEKKLFDIVLELQSFLFQKSKKFQHRKIQNYYAVNKKRYKKCCHKSHIFLEKSKLKINIPPFLVLFFCLP